MRWPLFWEMLKQFRAGAPLGDVATMKFAAMTDTPEHIRERMMELSGYAPTLETAELMKLAPGTLGREYAEFLTRNKLEHLSVSDALKERFADNPYAIRYTLTHDLHHLITGFDTGVAGELGVVAFATGQGVGLVGKRALKAIMVLYSVLLIGHIKELWNNMRVGFAMGEEASLVIGEKLESMLETPLEEIRSELGIEDATRAQILKSKPSLFARFLYRVFGQELPMPA